MKIVAFCKLLSYKVSNICHDSVRSALFQGFYAEICYMSLEVSAMMQGEKERTQVEHRPTDDINCGAHGLILRRLHIKAIILGSPLQLLATMRLAQPVIYEKLRLRIRTLHANSHFTRGGQAIVELIEISLVLVGQKS